ncbi:hypothetical protein Tco_0836306 [Tanacetum coccineum]
MFKSGTYKSLPEHVALYEALEAYMERANRDEFLAKKDKYRMTLPDSYLEKFYTLELEAPFQPTSSNPFLLSEQPIKDVPIPDDMNISDLEDTNSAHLPKIKTRPDWLKPVPEEDIPASPKPDWVIPLNDLPETENNWANALASSYQDPDEYKLLR